jgi:hypothetical protein
MAAQRLQKGDEYTKKLLRFTPETCAVIEARAEASHLSFNAALMEFIRTATPPDEWRILERKVRKTRRATAPV